MNPQELDEHLVFAKELALEAGALIRANFTLGMLRELKDDRSPVTETDKAVNRLVVEAVKRSYPGYGLLGEEESHEPERELLWICDPVDGTTPFVAGIPVSTFGLALVQDGQPLVAVAYDPYMDRLFAARKGGGATVNGQPIHVSDKPRLADGYVYASTRLEPPLPSPGTVYDRVLAAGSKPLALMSYIYGASLVAAGELLAAYIGGGNAWDLAPIKLLVEEAGGKVTDLQGNDRRYDESGNGLIASNGLVHGELIKLLK